MQWKGQFLISCATALAKVESSIRLNNWPEGNCMFILRIQLECSLSISKDRCQAVCKIEYYNRSRVGKTSDTSGERGSMCNSRLFAKIANCYRLSFYIWLLQMARLRWRLLCAMQMAKGVAFLFKFVYFYLYKGHLNSGASAVSLVVWVLVRV